MSFPLKESAMPKTESDGFCAHCGGEVGDDGYSKGMDEDGEVDSDVSDAADVDEGSESKQHQTDVQMRDEAGFANALRRRMR